MRKFEAEAQRSNVTLAKFLNYAKKRCEEKGLAFGIDRDVFENPPEAFRRNFSFFTRDGKKYMSEDNRPYVEYTGQSPMAAETHRVEPLDYQSSGDDGNGNIYNEICEFTFDDDKRGSGYYYQLAIEA